VLADAPPERIRILFVTPNLGVGGAERHIATLAPALDLRRFEPRVCCIKERGPLFDDVVRGGVPAISLESGTRQAPRTLLRLVRMMRRFRPHVVITRGLNADILGRIAATIARVPVVAVWKHNTGHIGRSALEVVSEKALDPFTDRYFAVAHGQVPYLTDELGWPGEKIRVIHNGVDPDAFPYAEERRRDPALLAELGLSESDRIVGILAVFRPEKDHATFLRAARIVADRLPGTRFVLAGDGPGREELEALTRELGLRDEVVFAGLRSDVEAVLTLLDVVVLSSFTIECFPYAILEAMAMGVPAVCTAVGGLPEMIDDGVTGRLVPPKDPAALAAGIVDVVSDRDRARAMGAAARRRLEQLFTLRRTAERTQEMIGEAVAESRGVAAQA
jgi:glycosyltransferase involved in cell wall biosynthesis